MNDRLKLLASAFRDTPLQCGDLTLRPLTAGTMLLLMDLENPLFLGDAEDIDEPDELSEKESLDALFQFIWIHTADEDEVIRLIERELRSTIREHVRKMALRIDFDALSEFQVGFMALMQRVTASMAEAMPEGEPGKPVTSPTGSPLTSGPSAEPGTPGANVISFGVSHSSAASSSSTPPSVPVAPAPGGPLPSGIIPLPAHPSPASPPSAPH